MKLSLIESSDFLLDMYDLDLACNCRLTEIAKQANIADYEAVKTDNDEAGEYLTARQLALDALEERKGGEYINVLMHELDCAVHVLFNN